MHQFDVSSIWGKSRGLERPYPLLAHLLDTAAIAGELLNVCPENVASRIMSIFSEAENPALMAAAFAGAHDLGKSSPSFQSQDPEAARGALSSLGGYEVLLRKPSRHDHVTQLTLPEAAMALGFDLGGSPSQVDGLLGVSCALGGHHGVFAAAESNESFPEDRFLVPPAWPEVGGPKWANARAKVLGELFDVLEVASAPIGGRVDELVLFAGFVVVSDWLASQESVITGLQGGTVRGSWSEHYAIARAAAPDVLADAGIRTPRRRRKISFSEAFGFEPNVTQRDIGHYLADKPFAGFLAVTVPMGAGKTEAALEAARLMGGPDRGLFFALPTMATADAMFERLLSHISMAFDGAVEASLLHGHSGLHEGYLELPVTEPRLSLDDETRAVASAWLRGRRRTMLSAVSAGTIDQVLSAVLPVRHGFLPWFGLAGKTVIIDEAHSLDAYMQRLLETALKWLGRLGVPVVVLSATMPQGVISNLAAAWSEGAGVAFEPADVAYPGWLHVSVAGCHTAAVECPDRTLKLELVDVDAWSDSEALCRALRSVLSPIETTGVALVVVNTVGDAQRITTGLREWADQNEIELLTLHARMRIRDRRRVTESVVSRLGPNSPARPPRLVLVATQVIEQSVDIDADLVISALAPIASLLQRAGRSHRHVRDRDHLPKVLHEWRLVVLRPTAHSGELEQPRGWRSIYPVPYLGRTDVLLGALGANAAIHVPTDVSGLVETVYSELAETSEVEEMLLAQWGDRMIAARSTIPSPSVASSLADLTSSRDDGLLATRLGTDSVPMLVLDRGVEGLTLDGESLPKSPSPDKVRWLLDATVPLRRTSQLSQYAQDNAHLVPPSWLDRALLRDIVIGVREPDGGVRIGGRTFELDDEIGWRQKWTASTTF